MDWRFSDSRMRMRMCASYSYAARASLYDFVDSSLFEAASWATPTP